MLLENYGCGIYKGVPWNVPIPPPMKKYHKPRHKIYKRSFNTQTPNPITRSANDPPQSVTRSPNHSSVTRSGNLNNARSISFLPDKERYYFTF